MKRPAAAKRKLQEVVPAEKPVEEEARPPPREIPCGELSLGEPLSHFDAACSIDELDFQARRIGFDANSFLEKGYAVLNPLWSPEEVSTAAAAAHQVRRTKGRDSNNEFVCLRPNIRNQRSEKLMLFSLINRYIPFLHQLLDGFLLPGHNSAPYDHHNQVQVAVKQPNFEGYADLQGMRSPNIGHVDQTISRQKTQGQPIANYSVLFGVVLGGETGTRDDAGNLWLAPGSHRKLQEAFCKFDGPIGWQTDIAAKYLGDEAPAMVPVRASPGQAIIMHHQTIHGVGPNHADQARVNVYFRVTASGRGAGKKVHYPEAMRDITKESPHLRQLAARQKRRKKI
ncbi:unnamed protein product [Symbiodinium sp. CCMP2592]|nr:unnamed protein product [Symbiodinium sp. CCMP2592]